MVIGLHLSKPRIVVMTLPNSGTSPATSATQTPPPSLQAPAQSWGDHAGCILTASPMHASKLSSPVGLPIQSCFPSTDGYRSFAFAFGFLWTLELRTHLIRVHRLYSSLTMTLKLYGNPNSVNTKCVAVILYLKKIPHELITVDIITRKDNLLPEYLGKQPFGEIPYLDDDGFVLYESKAICRYLEERYGDHGPALMPSDLKAKALFEQAVSVEWANFEAYAMVAGVEGVLKPKFFPNLPFNKALYDQAIKTLSMKLDVYETILAKQKFLAGDEMTLADLFHLPYGELLAIGGNYIMTTKGPNVKRWWTAISSLPSWQAVKDKVPAGVVDF
ncbi:hypothetical protein D9758_018350 [Tetrapyrgos nigripes]|uniref:glutathione transferase n=1 Tax=Tetrapyrgos nigripes TaxID=182062 RepID=A0A8H5BI27_9AGAR|nr:hypothetical protein D9758_018350 [Tetrapyrgos nigripes]